VKLAFLLYYCPDDEVLCSTCLAMSFLLPGSSDAGGMMRRLVELIRCVHAAAGCSALPSCKRGSRGRRGRQGTARVVRSALATVRAVVAADPVQTALGLQAGLLDALGGALAGGTRAARLDAIDTAAALAARGHGEAVIAAGIVPPVLALMESDVACRLRGLGLVRQLAWGTPAQIAALAQVRVVPPLLRLLRHFKEYDAVLRDVYGHQEATYNFDLLRAVVAVLARMLDGAQAAADGAQAVNAVAAQLDSEAADHLNAVRD
jgi:hypothetical protein